MCRRHCSRLWGHNSDQKRCNPHLHGPYILAEERGTDNEPKSSMGTVYQKAVLGRGGKQDGEDEGSKPWGNYYSK